MMYTEEQNRDYFKYFDNMVQDWTRNEEEKFCTENKLPRIELGGWKSQDEFGVLGISLDGAADRKEDVFRFLYGCEDNSIGSIRAKDFLEHISHCKNYNCTHEYQIVNSVSDFGVYEDVLQGDFCVLALIKEIYRVLVPNGFFVSMTPSTEGRGAFQDPTHCSFWNENSFWYYTNEFECGRYIGIQKSLFKAEFIKTGFPNNWSEQNKIAYVAAVLRKI